ncbi:MAG TPA: hypothetical protein VF904_18685 [Anaeromyxobacteraceae bacterium]
MILISAVTALAIGVSPASPAGAERRAATRPPPAARPAPSGAASAMAELPAGAAAVAGRFVVRQGDKLVPLREARRLAGGKKIGLDLRSGEHVVEARLDDDGWFVAPAAPGRWRLEYVVVGEGAEFFDPPREVDVRAGELSCAGQLELTLHDVEAELGANSGSRLEVKDACAELAPRLRALVRGPALGAGPGARPVDAPSPRRYALELLAGFRGEFAWNGYHSDYTGDLGSSFRGTYVLGLRAPLDTPGNLLVSASFGEVDRQTTGLLSRTSREYALGAGYAPWGWLELLAGGEYLEGRPGYAGGLSAWASARAGAYAFGLGFRARTGAGGPDLALTLDLSPLYLIGGLL